MYTENRYHVNHKESSVNSSKSMQNDRFFFQTLNHTRRNIFARIFSFFLTLMHAHVHFPLSSLSSGYHESPSCVIFNLDLPPNQKLKSSSLLFVLNSGDSQKIDKRFSFRCSFDLVSSLK